MSDEQIVDMAVNIAVKKSTENVFEILKKQGFEIKEKRSTFQKTEQLLYLMPRLKEAMNHNKMKIEDLKNYGIDKKGTVVKKVSKTTPIVQDEEELIKNEISKLLQRNHIIDTQIKWVNGVLGTIRNDKFFKILELKYYDSKTYEEMSEYFSCDVKTIGRNRSRLINQIKILFFPNDSIDELGN